MAGGPRAEGPGAGAGARGPGPGQAGAYRFAPARHTRPALRAGAEKCEGALIGRPAPRPPLQPPAAASLAGLSSRAVVAQRADLFGFIYL
ncbi:unnamed protein product [Leptosia nina]|uniref:Uncharacterized protein n=1 Tax=Leptosia nina TaxID=320188 RepID=A0AAV1JM71_9NEOP